MAFGDILEKVKDIFTGHSDNTDETAQPPVQQDDGGILPASQDPMGDPADQPQNAGYADQGGILPASQDPLGDPADDVTNGGQYGGDTILSASQDPLGDPADEQPA